MQLTQLFLINIIRSLSHEIGSALSFREGDYVADRITLSHNHDQTIQTESQTTVWRSTVFECVHHEAKQSCGAKANPRPQRSPVPQNH